MRSSTIKRTSAETDVSVSLTLDAGGKCSVDTGIGFFDHMLTLLSRHGFMDLDVKCKGDLNVDGHHTVEDVGICLGEALKAALGDKKGITRYGNMFLPMDEALVLVALDISARPFVVFNAQLSGAAGDFDAQLAEEFFRAFAFNAGITLHIHVITGENMHHIIEAMFKGLAKALAKACAIDARNDGRLPSTKELL
jgi:imidazoleglycerol-phosphate dehydratase